MAAAASPRYMIRNLWNVAPVLKTNLVATGLVDRSFNETLKRAAVMAFEEYTSTRLGGESNHASTTASTSTRRRRQRPQKSTRTPATAMRQPQNDTTSQQHLTDNDFFFQHQKNRGYRHANQSIATCECAEELQETFITNVVRDYLKHSSSSKSSMETNHHPNHELFSIDMWVAIQRGKGAYHADHVHEGALVSGVYYASVPLGSAPLVLRRPKNTANDDDDEQFPPYVVLSPTEGDLVLFPPWLEHGVPMVTEEQQAATNTTNHLPRVSFAFNATGAFASLGNENDDLWNHTTRTNNLA